MTVSALLDRRAAVARLLAARDRTLVVTGLGAATYDVAAAGDHDCNFYLWGAMGGAAMLGLGMALAQSKVPVLCITGDGEMLMGLGSFATIALQAPPNLTIVVLDNGLYGETGGQPTHTAHGADLAQIARGCGIADVTTVTTMAGVDAVAARAHAVGTAPAVAILKIAADDAPRVMAVRDGAYNKGRLRLALGLTAD